MTAACTRILVLSFLFTNIVLGQAPGASSSTSNDNQPQGQSLGEISRKLRKDHTEEVKMSEEDTQKLLGSVDKLLTFAAEDSGFPKHSAVKSRLVGSVDVENYTREHLAKEEYARRFARAEWTMKKFGLLPKNFSLREFVVKANGKGIAGYYDDQTKVISLLNWIPLEKQAPILAHELTHALQDQNYDLQKWQKGETGASRAGKDSETNGNDDSASARHAVVEGQAMVVLLDFVLAPVGRNLQNTPGLIYQMEDPMVKATIDSQLLHDAPMILREAGTFPYRSGLIFEGELLHAGGKQMAFAGAFTRPPRSSHEVLQPQTYIDGEKLPPIHLPDWKQVVANKYEIYETGGMGELDVRALLKQFGNRKIADNQAAGWRGGRYATFRKLPATGEPSSTADLALFYVSRWKSPLEAERFARLFSGAVNQRYQQVTLQPVAACAGTQCPTFVAHNLTEEGPVSVEQFAETVVVSESFDEDTAGKLRSAWQETSDHVQADEKLPEELGLRLAGLPDFSAFQTEIGRRICNELIESVSQH
jgi:hypothetical protein